MFKIIDRYIFREMVVYFVICIAVFTITSILSKVLKLIELVVSHGVGLFVVLKFILFIVPSFLIYIIPVSFLIAALITYNRLSSDNEITALKASGLNLLKISRPLVFMTFIAYAMSVFLTIYAFPWGSISSKRLIYDIVRNKAGVSLKERVFNDAFDGLILYINRISPEDGGLEGLFISDYRDEKDHNIISAGRGIISHDPISMNITLRLFDGTIHRAEEKELYKIITFSTYDLMLALKDGGARNTDISKTNRDLTLRQLRAKAHDVERAGEDPSPYIIDLHKRFALPASVFAFGLLALPLGIQKVRTTKFTSFAVGLGVVLVYYILSTALESLGERGMLHPVLSVWGSDIVMSAIGISVFYRAASGLPIRSLLWVDEKRNAILALVKGLLARGAK